MMAVLEYLRDFNFVTVLLRLVLAFFFGGFIGIERGKRGRAAGLRTHILVCMGATMTTLIGMYTIDVLGISSDPLRIGAQVISGIGFLGVGTILVTGRTHVKGLTTAAGLWTTAAIGLALGVGFYEAALLCMVLSVLAITQLNKIEMHIIGKNKNIEIYVEFLDSSKLNSTMSQINDLLSQELYHELGNIEVQPAKSGTPGSIGLEGILHLHKSCRKDEIFEKICGLENVAFIIENM